MIVHQFYVPFQCARRLVLVQGQAVPIAVTALILHHCSPGGVSLQRPILAKLIPGFRDLRRSKPMSRRMRSVLVSGCVAGLILS